MSASVDTAIRRERACLVVLMPHHMRRSFNGTDAVAHR